MALSLYNAIFRRLAADATVAALVATDDGPAIWEGLAQDGVFPNIAIEVEEQEDDAITEKTARHFEISINACALTPSARSDLHDAIKASLNRKQWTDQNVAVVSTLITSENRSADAEIGNPEQTYHISDISLSVIAEVATVTPDLWPFDTDFDFDVGALTGNDGWTTGVGYSSALVTASGIGPVDDATPARNNRELPVGAPLSNGPFYLAFDIDGIGDVDADQSIDVSVYASAALKAQISLTFNQGTGDLEYTIKVPGGNLSGTVSGFTPGPDRYVLSLNGSSILHFDNNAGSIFTLGPFTASLVTFDLIGVGITDESTEQSARISRVYFGASPIT